MKLYVSSKIKYASMWRSLRALGVPIISTWIDDGMPEQPADWIDLWERCLREAQQADVLVLYMPEPNDVLKGALVEVGAALAAGRRVFYVAAEPHYTFWHLPQVHFRTALDDVLAELGV